MSKSQIESALRKARQEIFNHVDGSPEEVRLTNEIIQLKEALAKVQCTASTGPYSGLTKKELAKSGTCETDWF